MAEKKELYFRKTNRSTKQSFTMDPPMFEIMVAIDGEKSIRVIANELKMPTEIFKKNVIKLVKLGLIEKIEGEQTYVETAFIGNMKTILTQLNGPLGEILLDDAAKEMGINPGRIPLSKLANYIEILVRDIPGEKQSNEFRELMFKEMKAIGL